jgi:hypothetical protein
MEPEAICIAESHSPDTPSTVLVVPLFRGEVTARQARRDNVRVSQVQ